MKKALSILLVAVMVLGLAACGSSSSAPATTATAAPAPAAATAAPASEPAQSEPEPAKIDYPTKPITIIVPNGTGGGSDLSARAVAKFAEKYLGVSMVVENREGGGQTVAHTYFKSVPNDGYTLIIYGNSGTIVTPILQSVEYDPFGDEEALGRITNLRNALVVNAKAPYQTLDEFMAYCKEHPGVKLATSGANGIDDLTARMMNLRYDTGLIPVAYDSGGEAALAVLSEECEVACTSVSSCLAQVQAGNLTILGLACDTGDPNLPEYKTCAELGYDVALNNSIGLAVPAGTDPEIKAILEEFLANVTSDPEFVSMMNEMGFVVDYLNIADFDALVHADAKTVQDIVDSGA